MLDLLGDYPCKLDNKGRLQLPSKLRKQLEPVLHEGLWIRKDLHQPCLVIYPKPEWDRIKGDFAKLNRHSRKHSEYIRKFLRGAAPIELDTAGRMNLPNHMLEHIGLDIEQGNEVMLMGLFEKLELWSRDKHQNEVENLEDFDALADEIEIYLNDKDHKA
jgi:MraZ protein